MNAPLNRPAKNFRLLTSDLPSMAKLRDDWRQALSLCDIDGKSYQAIAHAMHIPVNTVRTHIHKARLKILALRQSSGGHPVQTP